jgi:hypothetical protein
MGEIVMSHEAFFDSSSFQVGLHTLDYETHSTSCTIRGWVGWKFQRRYHALTSHVLIVGPCLHVMTWLVTKCTIWSFRFFLWAVSLVASTLFLGLLPFPLGHRFQVWTLLVLSTWDSPNYGYIHAFWLGLEARAATCFPLLDANALKATNMIIL